MKYCKKCKRIYKDSNTNCTKCRKSPKLTTIKDINTPVYLLSAGGAEKTLVKAAFEDAEIPIVEQSKPKSITTATLALEDYMDTDILVPFSAYKKAYDTAVGIGVLEPMDEKEEEFIQSEIDKIKPEKPEEFEEMSKGKRWTVRIISAILFILLCALVIFGVDHLMEFIIKTFFS